MFSAPGDREPVGTGLCEHPRPAGPWHGSLEIEGSSFKVPWIDDIISPRKLARMTRAPLFLAPDPGQD